MYDIVVCPLGESTVYITERHKSLLCQSSGKGGGMSLGNAHVESPVRHLLHHDIERTTRRHGRGDAHNLGILLSQFENGATEHYLVFQRLSRLVLHDALTGINVKFARGMPYLRGFLRWGISLTLHRVQV